MFSHSARLGPPLELEPRAAHRAPHTNPTRSLTVSAKGAALPVCAGVPCSANGESIYRRRATEGRRGGDGVIGVGRIRGEGDRDGCRQGIGDVGKGEVGVGQAAVILGGDMASQLVSGGGDRRIELDRGAGTEIGRGAVVSPPKYLCAPHRADSALQATQLNAARLQKTSTYGVP